MKTTQKSIKKILLVGALALTMSMGMIGCSSNEKNPNNSGNNTGQVEPEKPVEKEMTPLEKEISELEDYQETDKVYDNKDLEPFNKIMGYYYVINKGRDESRLIDVIPPEKLKQYHDDADAYELIGKVVVPCKFLYSEDIDAWTKIYPFAIGATEWYDFLMVPAEYKYISDEELTEIFGKESGVRKQFVLK